MIINVTNKEYWSHFLSNHHPYVSEWFIDLVKEKADKILFLINKSDLSIGLVAGVIDNSIYSPFSAPFGGFHYSHEHLMYDTIYNFIEKLKKYAADNFISSINITLPPDIYQSNMNAKLVNAFIKSGYEMKTPNIFNWINLSTFDGKWAYSKVANRCRKAIKNDLYFQLATEIEDKESVYNLIKQNRIGKGRHIHMSLNEVIKVTSKIPVDFFMVTDKDSNIVAASIIYRGCEGIAQAIFMGDNLHRRDLGAIDFLYMNIYNHYKNMGYKYIDFGTSSLDGEPNSGLIRFKEIHNCETSLEYTFLWNPDLDKKLTESYNSTNILIDTK